MAVPPQPIAIVTEGLHLVGLPVRGFVPVLAVEHVELAVFVYVRDGHSLGPELGIKDGLLPRDFRIGDGGGGESDEERYGRQREAGKHERSLGVGARVCAEDYAGPGHPTQGSRLRVRRKRSQEFLESGTQSVAHLWGPPALKFVSR